MLLSEIMAMGTYVAVVPTPSTMALLRAWADQQHLELDENLHVTLLYSRKVVHVVPKSDEFVATGVAFDKFGDALVLKLQGDSLVKRHDQLIALGGTHDYPDFNPHLTIQAKSTLNPQDVEVPDFGMIFWQEHTEPLDP